MRFKRFFFLSKLRVCSTARVYKHHQNCVREFSRNTTSTKRIITLWLYRNIYSGVFYDSNALLLLRLQAVSLNRNACVLKRFSLGYFLYTMMDSRRIAFELRKSDCIFLSFVQKCNFAQQFVCCFSIPENTVVNICTVNIFCH